MQHISLKFIVLLFVLALTSNLYGQDDDLPTSEVEIVKDYEVELIKSKKPTLQPKTSVKQKRKPTYTYDISDKVINVDYEKPSIRPQGMKSEKGPEAYDSYAKVGYGWPSSPYAETFLSYELDRDLLLTLNGRYHGLQDQKWKERKTHNLDIVSGIQYNAPSGIQLGGHILAAHDKYSFYGYGDSTQTQDPPVHKIFNLGFDTYVQNAEQNSWDVDYAFKLGFNRTNGNLGIHENQYAISGEATKWFNKLGIKLGFVSDLINSVDSSHNVDNNVFHLVPELIYYTDVFRISGGVKLGNYNGQTKVFPKVEAQLMVMGSNLTAFAGVNGQFQNNTYKSIVHYNPFATSAIDQYKASSFNDFYGGVKGRFAPVAFQGQVGYKKADDLILYVTNRFNNGLTYDITFDELDIIYVKGHADVDLVKNLNLGADLSYNFYGTEDRTKAWFLPRLEFSTHGKYKALDDNLHLTASLHLRNPVSSPLTPKQENGKPNTLLDLSLGGEYFFTKNFGAFVNLNNLAANEYIRWHNYPSIGFNVLGGIKARF